MTISLEKRAETVGITLEKRGLKQAPIMRVCAGIDISGSMTDEFADGSVQHAFDQLLGISMKFDDNGEIDVWAFDTKSHRAPSAKPEDYNKYIGTRRGQGKFGFWPGGGTNYAPVLRDIVAEMFPEEKKGFFNFSKKPSDNSPVMVLFITDGEPSDGTEAARVIADARSKNIYFQLIGVGNDCRFNTLKRIADDYENAGFVQLINVKMSDEELYDALISPELVTFIKNQKTVAFSI